MLVLSRKKDEKILIGKAGDVLTAPIEILVVEIRSDKARLGIEATKDIHVDREEVYHARLREQSELDGTEGEPGNAA